MLCAPRRLMEEFIHNDEASAYIHHTLAIYFKNCSAVSREAASHNFTCQWKSSPNGQPCTATLNTDTMVAHLRTHHGVTSRSRVCNWGKCHNHPIDCELKRHLPRHYPTGIKEPTRVTIKGAKFGSKTFGDFEYKPDPVGRADMAPRSVAKKIRRQIAASGFQVMETKETKSKAKGQGKAKAQGRGRKRTRP